MNLSIRQEIELDHNKVATIIESAFANEKYSDHCEHYLVERLRKSDAFIPELSLVAEIEDKIAGHILLTKISIKNCDRSFPSLALAPVSVLPDYQNKGIGSRLIEAAHQMAIDLGYRSIVLLGHEKYYPRFGYQRADSFGITLPFDVPLENCMALELWRGSLKGVSGVVEYTSAFFE